MDPAEREAKLHLVKYEQVGLACCCLLSAVAYAGFEVGECVR